MMTKFGIEIENPPKDSCNDKNCPYHGELIPKQKSFIGTVKSDKMQKTVSVEWIRKVLIPKYERYAQKRSIVKAHIPPCIEAKIGDKVRIIQCRPLSKSKNFVVVEKVK